MTARKILIVEDESIVRLHLRRIVEGMGHHVVGLAGSADEAIVTAAATKPDLVLMDINLRGENDGVDAAKEIVADQGCAMVFATAFADDETIRRTAEAGAVGYVLKPFGESAVRAALVTALHEHDRVHAVRSSAESLTGIISSLGEAIVLVDPEWRVLYLNPRAESLARSDGGDVVGRHVSEILRIEAGDASVLADALQAVCRGTRSVVLPSISLRTNSGDEVLVNGSIEPVSGSGTAGYVIALRELNRHGIALVARTDDACRMMIYSHDTFGLGHLRRSLNLAAALVEAVPELSVLLVTGSAMAHRFKLPPRVDYVKLPAVRKVAAERYSPRSLAVPDDDVLALRANLLLRSVRDFRPDLLLVDHSPAGMRGEMRPALAWLREELPSCETMIGLRDIIDDPAAVIQTWREQGITRLLSESYDHIVVYGEREFFDPVEAYDFAPELARKVRFVGHVVEASPQSDASAGPDGDVPHVVVTTGGGDGAVDEVAGGFLRMLRNGRLGRRITATVLPGPLAPADVVSELQELAAGTDAVVETFVASTSPHMAAADAVICTGGYNTAIQVLRYARRAVMVPRVMHRREQFLRAHRLAELGLVACLTPDELTPDSLASVLTQLLDESTAPLVAARERGVVSFDGAANLASFCSSLLATCRAASEASHD